MNIYEKLQTMRVELQEMKIKKSGKNKFANYDYYELADILPPINSIMAKHKVCSYISFNSEQAILTLVNAEQPEEVITFTSPMAEASLKGTHPIQNLGAVETYQRRYLYMAAFEIVENDFLDATQGNDQQQKQPKPQQQKQQQKPQTKTPEKSLLSQSNKEMINSAIQYLNEVNGTPIKEITKQIEAYMKKPIKQISDADVDAVCEFLSNLVADPF